MAAFFMIQQIMLLSIRLHSQLKVVKDLPWIDLYLTEPEIRGDLVGGEHLSAV